MTQQELIKLWDDFKLDSEKKNINESAADSDSDS